MIKQNARNYEFQRFLDIKSTKSKLKNLKYPEFKIQEYLLQKSMNGSRAKALFKFRVRMAPFGENFKGGQPTQQCPLCQKHSDTQEESFNCETMNRLIEIEGCYNDIFGFNFDEKLVKSIQKIYNFREEYRKLS